MAVQAVFADGHQFAGFHIAFSGGGGMFAEVLYRWIESDVVVPVEAAAGKEQSGARTLRPIIRCSAR